MILQRLARASSLERLRAGANRTATAVVIAIVASGCVVGGCSREQTLRERTANSKPDTAPEGNAASRPLSRFENTAADVKYLGTSACVECHAEQNQSYQTTAHHHALAEIDLADEPQPAQYTHSLSGRWYAVSQDVDKQQLIHREGLIGDATGTLGQAHAVRYAIGSGNHSRSYLLELDQFLIESPITWYRSRGGYGMSPGFDRAAHNSFERMADVGCVYCHAGRVSGLAGNRFRPVFHELTIGCENCHGPGELHVRKHRGKLPGGVEEEDLSIVNPQRLSRETSEAVCAQCHLRGSATVHHPGMDHNSFRPGLPLQASRVDYVLKHPTETMNVVGHVEQMRLSACYVKSETLTCTTCHDPHSTVPREERIVQYRAKCLACHSSGCPSPEQPRLKKVPDDNCVTCHMPQRPTDIPHFAFTHHRIGVHADERAEKQPVPDSGQGREVLGELIPIYDVSNIPRAVQQRDLGLAYFEFSEAQKSKFARQEYRRRAESLLYATHASPLRDADTEIALARIYWERDDLEAALRLAESTLGIADASTGARTNALFLLGESRLRQGDFVAARGAFEQLVKERRIAEDWVLLSQCHMRTGLQAEAARCLEQALAINPWQGDIHEALVEIYRRLGDDKQVQKHADALKALMAVAREEK